MITAYICLVIIVAALFLIRNGGGGSLGKKIRASDHWAWEEAVKDKERELQELKNAEPRV